MYLSRLPFTALAKNALVDTLTHTTYWVPALVLLSPTMKLEVRRKREADACLVSLECDSKNRHADRDRHRGRRHRRLRLQGSPAHVVKLISSMRRGFKRVIDVSPH